jgi:hypothetical protein
MRPLTHDDPDAIPRNGTEVPWVDVPDLFAADPPADEAPPAAEASRAGATGGTAPGRRVSAGRS